MNDDLQINQVPVQVVEFDGQEVPVYEVEGEYFLTGEDLGRILGLAEPRTAVRKIYNRNKAELEMHARDTNLVSRDGRPRPTCLYNEVGAHLIAMFAQTPRAREVRQWLAALPRRLRRVQAMVQDKAEILPEVLERVRKEAVEEAANRLLELLARPVGQRLGIKHMLRILRLREQGLTQTEVGKLYGVSRDTVGNIEKELGELLGVKIHRVHARRREKETIRAFAQMLSAALAPGALGKADVKVMH